jgi:GTP-binding protein
MDYAPIIFTSAADGHNFQKIPAMLSEVMENMRMKIPTSLLNRIVGDAVKKNSPTSVGTSNHYFKIYYATMIGNEPPRFVFFVNDPKICTANYVSYLNNSLRKSLGLTGLPIKLQFRAREKVIKPKRNY